MKRKLKRTLILVLLAVASLFILAGCSFKKTRESIIKDLGLEATVVYHANGGIFDNRLDVKTLDFVSGQPALNIGVVQTSPSQSVSRTNYIFDGWYFVVLDEAGQPTYIDSEKKFLALGEPVDFSKNLEKGDYWIVAASWKAKSKVVTKLVLPEGVSLPNPDENAEKKEFVHGEILAENNFGTDGLFKQPPASPFAIEETYKDDDGKTLTRYVEPHQGSYTFAGYFADEACTKLAFAGTGSLTQQEADTVIYAKFLVGDWKLIKDAASAHEMFETIKNNRVKCDGYWIMNDIDMKALYESGQESPLVAFATFKGIIHSYGATIKNFQMKKEKVAFEKTASVFGKILDSAELVNVNFEGLTLNCSSLTDKFKAYFLFEAISEKANVQNVNVSGNLNITSSANAYVENLMNVDLTMKYDSYLFGGYANDAAYVEASGGTGFIVVGKGEDIVKIN